MKKIVYLLIVCILVSLYPNPSFIATAENNSEIPVVKMEDQFVMFEAEDMWLNPKQELWRVTEDDGASSGKYLHPRANTTAFEEARDFYAAYDNDDYAKMYIDVEEEAYYTFWVRVHYLNGVNNGNFWYKIGDEELKMVHFSHYEGEYTWNSMKTIKLSKGRYYFALNPRRLTMGADKILITSSEYYAPIGDGEKPVPFALGMENQSLKGLYFPLPAYTPPMNHPRLYITDEKLPQIKENLTKPANIDAWNEVQKIANTDKVCKVRSDVAYSYDESVHQYIEACAFMYLLDRENNRKYGEKAVKGLIEYVTTLSYSGDNISMARSGILQYIAKVYDWCHDLLTDEQKELIIKKGLAVMTKLETGWPPVKLFAFNSDHGGEGGIQVDSMSFAIATYEDYPDIWNAVAGRFFSEFIAINNFYYDIDHYQGEGDSYGHSRFTYETRANTILTQLGLEKLVSDNERYIPYNLIYRRRPDGMVLRTGDIWDLRGTYAGPYTNNFACAMRYNDPFLEYEAHKMGENGLTVRHNDGGTSLVEYLVLNNPDLMPLSHENLPLAWYSGTGHNMLTLRTSWDEGVDSNTMLVSINGGGRQRGGHTHQDLGNFEIYYKGPLAIDSGVYNGDPFYDETGKYITDVKGGSFHDYNYHRQTVAHNCVTIYDPDMILDDGTIPGNPIHNSGGQISRRVSSSTTYNSATDDSHIGAENIGIDYGPDLNNPAYAYMKTDLSKAYTYRIDNYTRTFTYFNFFDDVYPGALIVFDKVKTTDKDFEKTWNLHSQEEPEIKDGTTVIKRTEYGFNGRLINETLLPKAEDRNIVKVGGEGMEYSVRGVNMKAVTPAATDESGKWRIEVTPKTKKDTDYFLNVLQVSENNSEIIPLETKLYETENYVGVKIKDRVAYLSKNYDRTSEEQVIYADGSENNLSYVVDGLNTGKWVVYDENNNTVAECDVTNEGGVVNFEAPAGTYRIKKLRGYLNIPSKNFDLFANIKKDTVPLKIKLNFNKLYQYYKTPFMEIDNIAYIPLKEFMEKNDKKSLVTEDGNIIKLTYEDINYEFDLALNTVKKYDSQTGSYQTIEISRSIINKDDILYIPLSVFDEVFEKKCSYDTVAKIIRIESYYKRAEDYILNSDDPDRIKIISTSDENSYNNTKAFMAVDGDESTNWSANTNGPYAIFEFENIELLNKVRVNWLSPSVRAYNYEFYISEDGENWTLLKKGNSGFMYSTYADYEFEPVRAKYFKVVAFGNSLNQFFIFNEIKFFKDVSNK